MTECTYLMSEKFRGKYRNESIRLQNWDYGWNAAYYITICTKDRIHFFGEIENKTINLSETMKNFKEFQITSKTIPKIGKKINWKEDK